MAGANESPRQKMIGLMYLVLMALLAMNVSKEVINSFITLSNNMDAQAGAMAIANSHSLMAMEGKLTNPEITEKEKLEIQEIIAKAQQIHEMTRVSANFYIENADELLQIGQEGDWIIESNDGFKSVVDLVVMEYEKKDDYDIPTKLFVGDDHTNINEKGLALKTNMHNYRDSLCIILADRENKETGVRHTFVPPTITRNKIEDTTYYAELEAALINVKDADKITIRDLYNLLTLPENVLNHGEDYNWVAGQFDHAPIAAATAMLTNLKGKIIQAEKYVFDNFMEENKVPPFKFNSVRPLAFASSSYINKGDSLKMSVMVAAFDSTATSEVRYWYDDETRSPENMQSSSLDQLTFGGGVGDHIIVGDIAVETPNGKEWQPFTYNYSVGAPNATIAASDLNVLYSNGWQNKISVSASGYDPSTVSVSGSNCKISKSGDGYIATATETGKTATISVKARDKDGNSVTLSTQTFRIFGLPKPEAVYANQGADNIKIARSRLQNSYPLKAKLVDCPLDVNYTVKSYDLVMVVNNKQSKLSCSGAQPTDEIAKALKRLAKGATFSFANVKVAGPDGKSRIIPGLTFIVD